MLLNDKFLDDVLLQSVGIASETLRRESGVAIKYRIISELYDEENSEECFKLKQELENSERANKMLWYLRNRKEYHVASLFSVENSLNILIDMGFAYGRGFKEFL